MVANLLTGSRRVSAIPLLVHVDGLYQVELHVAWIVLWARGAHHVIWGVQVSRWSFHGSKGYIDAVRSCNPRSSPLSERPLAGLLQVVMAGHFVAGYPWRHLFRLAVHLHVHMGLETFSARWSRRAVTEWGVVSLYGSDAFAINVGSPERDEPHLAAGVHTVYVVKVV